MARPAHSLRSFLLLAMLVGSVAHAATSDRIFASGFSQALVIEGSAGYPGPLANAQVEAHFGDAVATATSAADGTYRVGIEVDQIATDAIVELIARGVGTQTHLVWASPLGPASRLLAIAGPNHRIGFAQDPFVHLSPRSTVLAAAIRGHDGWQPITDVSTFWRAIRGRERTSDDLVYALALVARGEIPLPEGANDTFEAVLSSSRSQFLNQSYWSLLQGQDCTNPQSSIFCDVDRNLPLDPRVFPPSDWTSGELYSSMAALRTPTLDVFAFQPQNNGAIVTTSAGMVVASAATTQETGTYELSPVDPDIVYMAKNMRAYVGNAEVPSLWEATRLYVRMIHGPAGQVEIAWSPCWRISYPQNPEIPTRETPCDRTAMPQPSSSNPLPVDFVGRVPVLAGRRWVLPSPLRRPVDASIDSSRHGYDIHVFDTDEVTAERSGRSFTYVRTTPTTFSLQGSGVHAEFRFLNEEEPDVWRVRMHVSGTDGDGVVEGLLIPADAGALTAADSTGTWRNYGYGDLCRGIYAEFTCDAGDRIESDADGNARQIYPYGPTYAGHWALGNGADAGRLLFDWEPSGTPGSRHSRLGWESVHEDGVHRWVLQTRTVDTANTGSAPPILFNPTMWLVRYDRQ